MYLIRSIAQAQSGRRDEAVGLMKEFGGTLEKEFGQAASRVLTASVGPADTTVVMENVVKSLGDWEKNLEAVNKSAAMQKYGPKFGEVFISGSHRFEIYRIHS